MACFCSYCLLKGIGPSYSGSPGPQAPQARALRWGEMFVFVWLMAITPCVTARSSWGSGSVLSYMMDFNGRDLVTFRFLPTCSDLNVNWTCVSHQRWCQWCLSRFPMRVLRLVLKVFFFPLLHFISFFVGSSSYRFSLALFHLRASFCGFKLRSWFLRSLAFIDRSVSLHF